MHTFNVQIVLLCRFEHSMLHTVNPGIVFRKYQPELNRCGVPGRFLTWQAVCVFDDLRVRTEGDRQRRPLITELLTVGEERKREIRIHYRSCKGKWDLSVCMNHCVMWGYSQGEKSKYVSIPHAGIYNASVFSTAESSHFFRKMRSTVPWRLIILLNLSLGNTHLQSGSSTILSGLLELSSISYIFHWSAVKFEHACSVVFIRQSVMCLHFLQVCFNVR